MSDGMRVFRIQPQGAALHGRQTVTSTGELADGVHVFDSLGAARECRDWMEEVDVELVTIECEAADIAENGDYEGSLLLRDRGRIVERRRFRSTREISDWIDEHDD